MEITYKKSTRLLAAAGFLFTTMIWGGSFVVMKNSVDQIPPSYLLAIRFSLAAILLALVFHKSLCRMNMELLRSGLIMGIFLTLAYLLQTYGIKYTTASKNAFITALYVILVPFIHWKVSGKRPGSNHILAAVVAVAGLALLTLHGTMGINFGDILTFCCGICFAIHMVCTDRFTENHDPILLTIIQIGFVGIANWFLAPYLDGTDSFSFGMLAEMSIVSSLFYLAVFCTMIGFLIQTTGQKYLSANTSALLLSLESVFGTLLSVIFLKEILTDRMILGCVLMFLSILISELHINPDQAAKRIMNIRLNKKTRKDLHG